MEVPLVDTVGVCVIEVDTVGELRVNCVPLKLEVLVVLGELLGVRERVPVPVGEASCEKEGEGVQEGVLLGRLRVRE